MQSPWGTRTCLVLTTSVLENTSLMVPILESVTDPGQKGYLYKLNSCHKRNYVLLPKSSLEDRLFGTGRDTEGVDPEK